MRLDSSDKYHHDTPQKVNNQYFFKQGRSDRHKPILLKDFTSNAIHLTRDLLLIKGHPSHKKIREWIHSRYIGESFANHVSARDLSSHDVPTLIQHRLLKPKDKRIWDASYREEYDGFVNLPTWVTITEEEYNQMKHKTGKYLTTMAVSTIKFDEHNRPKRAKYRIVALGNLDPHDWNKSDTYAPAMSLVDLRLMVMLAIHNKRVLKSGDFKQAFVQATLPPDEAYVLKPAQGCPISEPNTYWLLQRTLYGLKRSPRHWFEKATKILKSLGLQPLINSPCIFKGPIIPGKPDLYLGLYVDDFVYFSTDDAVEEDFKRILKELNEVNFMGKVTHFLGHKFSWKTYTDDKQTSQLKVHLSQEAFADNLVTLANLDQSSKLPPTPYRSGFPVDPVPDTHKPHHEIELRNQMRCFVGSLLWLSQGTRPDLSTITAMLAQYQNNPSKGHVDAARYVIRYVKNTKTRGIVFDSHHRPIIKAYNQFPIDPLHVLTDANWGAQDQSHTTEGAQTPLFKSRSMSGHIIHLHGPLHWQSKRQTITARSSAESEIYATDECVRELEYLRKVMTELNLKETFFQKPTSMYNDNMVCVQWCHNRTTRTIRHIQLRDNAVREAVQSKKINVTHIPGKDNIADIFTKEDRDKNHFTSLRDRIVFPPFICNNSAYKVSHLDFTGHQEVHLEIFDATGGVSSLPGISYLH